MFITVLKNTFYVLESLTFSFITIIFNTANCIRNILNVFQIVIFTTIHKTMDVCDWPLEAVHKILF